jgi:hypothetical protein
MTWKGSAQIAARGQWALIADIQPSCRSTEIASIAAQRSGPRVMKNASRVARDLPGAAQTSRPESWSLTQVRYRWPLR